MKHFRGYLISITLGIFSGAALYGLLRLAAVILEEAGVKITGI